MVYHINLMLQYHVLKKHTKGKEVYYEINKQHLNNIVNLTKALQASNLLTSYMPAPQGTSEDIANNALASIINPTYNGGK